MSIISYGGNRLIPAPFVSITKEYQRTGNGEIVGTLFNITLNGTIVSYKGSPTSSGTFHTTSGYPDDEIVSNDARLAAIERKQDAIRELFSQDGLSLEIQSADGSQPIKFNPRIGSVNFAEGLWFTRCEYTISLEADVMYPQDEDDNLDFESFINGAEESWDFEASEELLENTPFPRTYRLTHTVSAQGKRFFDSAGNLVREPWENARNYVVPKLGFDSSFILSSGVSNLPSFYGAYNHIRNEQINELGGSYSVTESWVVTSGNAVEDYDISTNISADNGLTSVSINGNIIGLEERNSDYSLSVSKFTNASGLFSTANANALTRAQKYSGVTLNPIALNQSIGRNIKAGTINYNYTYDTRIGKCFPGVKSEVVTITDSLNNDVFAAIGVLGRTAGPVLQDIGTRDASTRSLQIELVLDRSYQSGCVQSAWTDYLFTQKPSVAPATSSVMLNIIAAANPVNQESASQVFINNQNETWEPIQGRYSYSIDWTYEI